MRSIILAFIKANVKNALRQLRLLQWAFYRGGPVPLRTGVELYLNPKCDTSRKLFSRRSTEPELIAFLSRVIMPGALAIDVGANIGYISTHLSRCVGETGRVLAFEPDPRSFPFLKKNIELNGCKNAQAYPLGLSDKRGTDQLFLATYATGNTTLYEPTIESAGDRPDRPGHRHSESVEIIRLDDLSRMLDFKVGNIQTILKVDVEGLEIRVLMGGEALFRTCKNLITIIEFSPEQFLQAGSSLQDFFGFCRQQSLSIFKFSPNDSLIPLIDKDLMALTETLMSGGAGQHDDLVLIKLDSYTAQKLF